MIKFNFVETKEHLAIIRELFLEHAPPNSRLILALEETNAVGCVALRKIDNGSVK